MSAATNAEPDGGDPMVDLDDSSGEPLQVISNRRGGNELRRYTPIPDFYNPNLEEPPMHASNSADDVDESEDDSPNEGTGEAWEDPHGQFGNSAAVHRLDDAEHESIGDVVDDYARAEAEAGRVPWEVEHPPEDMGDVLEFPSSDSEADPEYNPHEYGIGLAPGDPDLDIGLYHEDMIEGDEEFMDDVHPAFAVDDFDEMDVQDEYLSQLQQLQSTIQPGYGSDNKIPSFWGMQHDESDDEVHAVSQLEPDIDEEDESPQESFFSNTEYLRLPWFHLSAASNHHQSADSLCGNGTPSCSTITGSQEEEIVMLNNNFTLAVWRLPAASAAAAPASASASATNLTASQRASVRQTMNSWGASPSAAAAASASAAAAEYLEAPDHSSLLRSSFPDDSEEELSDHAVEVLRGRMRERFKDTRNVQKKAMKETAIVGEADAVLMAFTELRFRAYSIDRSPDGRFVAVGGSGGFVSLYELAVNPDHTAPEPSNSPSDTHGQTEPTPDTHRQTAEASDTHGRTAATSDMHGQTDSTLRSANLADHQGLLSANKCPLALQLISHIALESQNGMIKSDTMCNSVRFGMVGGRLRLLAACQNSLVYIFEVGPGPLDSAPAGLPCHSLHNSPESTSHPDQHQVLFMSDQQLHDIYDIAAHGDPEDNDWEPYSSRGSTAVLNSFPGPCNFAVASPDGHWIAVVGDTSCVLLLHSSDQYSLHGKTDRQPSSAKRRWPKSYLQTFRPKRPRAPSRRRRYAEDPPGSQYCCWNSDSSLVAVSSDYYQAVMVFNVHTKQQVLRFEDHLCPCLALSFAPWDPQLLVFAESSFRLYITDLRNVSKARQRLHISVQDQNTYDDTGDHVVSNFIRGLVITPGGRLLIAHSDRLVQCDFLMTWSASLHKRFPTKFKQAVQLLLLASASKSEGSSNLQGSETELAALPKEVLLRIIGLAALPLGQWLAGLPQRAATEGMPQGAMSMETLRQIQAMPVGHAHGHYDMI